MFMWMRKIEDYFTITIKLGVNDHGCYEFRLITNKISNETLMHVTVITSLGYKMITFSGLNWIC